MRILLYGTAAGISAIGTIPYAYAFSQPLQSYNPSLAMIVGAILAATAAVANMCLGTYSLIKFTLRQQNFSTYYVLILSISSAVPIGFMTFFAFQNILPIPINSIFTLAVVMTNAAIAYNAVLNAILELKSYRKVKSIKELSAKEIGLLVGILVSLAGFVATTNGLNQLFNYFGLEHTPTLSYLSTTIGLIVWVPFAALYGHSTQLCFDLLFKWLRELVINLKKLKKFEVFVFLFSVLSASSYTQIFITFFNKEMMIPEFLKLSFSQFFIYKFILPLAVVAASSVNYLALMNLIRHYKTMRLRKI